MYVTTFQSLAKEVSKFYDKKSFILNFYLLRIMYLLYFVYILIYGLNKVQFFIGDCSPLPVKQVNGAVSEVSDQGCSDSTNVPPLRASTVPRDATLAEICQLKEETEVNSFKPGSHV